MPYICNYQQLSSFPDSQYCAQAKHVSYIAVWNCLFFQNHTWNECATLTQVMALLPTLHLKSLQEWWAWHAFMTCLPCNCVPSAQPETKHQLLAGYTALCGWLGVSTCGCKLPELGKASVRPSGHLCFELGSCPHQSFLRGELGLCQFGILQYSHYSTLTVKLILAARSATCS